MEQNAADILENAADALEVHGWTKHRSRDPLTGGMCAMGALTQASFGEKVWAEPWLMDHNPRLYQQAGDALGNHVRPGGMGRFSVAGWNDQARDKYEVIEAMRATAKDLRNQA